VTGLACKASQSGKVHGGLVVALAASFIASGPEGHLPAG
jgi:hypothetical protein